VSWLNSLPLIPAFAANYIDRLGTQHPEANTSNGFHVIRRGVILPGEHDGVVDIAEGSHSNGFERLKRTIQAARAIQIDSHPLKECLEGYHRSGVCHQLANENRLTWVPSQTASVWSFDTKVENPSAALTRLR
jgi:hypothetical protein